MISFYEMVVENVVSVWRGNFQNETDLFDFVDFVYDSDGNSTNQFCQEVGLDWFDHDFQEANFFGHDIENVKAALSKHSWSETFLGEVIKKLSDLPEQPFNSFFLLYDFHYQPPLARPKDNSRLKFIGSFAYQKD